jgi:CBS domain-containing protein
VKAREVMSSPVVTVTTATGVREAGELLCANGFTALPVVDDDDGSLVGIVTEADLIRDRIPPDPRVHGSHRPHRATSPLLVADVMTSPVESLTAGADISDAARIMVDERIRCLPIVDGGAPVGIVTRRDLLRAALAHDDDDLVDEISRQLAGVDNPDRWTVSVQAGVADIEDFGTDAAARAQAARLAAAVPGVVHVRARHQTPDPF